MKLTVILSLIFSVSLQAQVADQFFNAVGKSDAAGMGTHLASDIELCVNDETNIVSKSEALTSMKSFLNKNKPIKITPMHGGSNAKNNSNYKLAKLETNKGTFRVFVFQGSTGKIQEIRFDKF